MNELEVFKQLSKTQPQQDLLKSLTNEQIEQGIRALGEWRFVLACEAVARELPKKRQYASLRDYLVQHLDIPRGTAYDLAERVLVSLDLMSDSTELTPRVNPAEMAKSLTRDQARHLAKSTEARTATRGRIARGEDPQKVVGEVVASTMKEPSKELRGNVSTTPLNRSPAKQQKSVESLLGTIEGAVAGLLSIEQFHPDTTQEDLDDWIKRIGVSHDKTLIFDLGVVRKRMIARRDGK